MIDYNDRNRDAIGMRHEVGIILFTKMEENWLGREMDILISMSFFNYFMLFLQIEGFSKERNLKKPKEGLLCLLTL